ncbi:MAG TPA: ATP-binding protein [Labilithrix sp.]|nr:ATP-binding protein [Labilithrix sp.]
MLEALRAFFSGPFMPHGHCYLWMPEMVWLQVISNFLIGAAYVSISSTLYYVIRRIRDVPFSRMYLAFGVFIITCGLTHFLDVVTVWTPVYWVDGAVRAVTAVASVGTAVLLFPLVPKAVHLADAAQLAHEQGQKLESMYEELAAAHAKTKEAEQLKAQFFANVSHELRTPLSLVIGLAERLLSVSNFTEEQRRDIAVIERNGRSLLKHVNDLLAVATIEAGRVRADYARVDVSHLAKLVLGMFDNLARERDITVTDDVAPDVVAELDRDKVECVLMNVVGNAFKFTPDGGKVRCSVRLETRDEKPVVVVEVADSGPGIPEASRSLVFERFAQLEGGDSRRFGGTGLGLAIAHDVVALHHGQIRIEDAPEGGALFRIELPARAPAGASVATESPEVASDRAVRTIVEELRARPPRDSATGQGGERGTVLVVEDNVEMNAFISEELSADYRVERAFDGVEGLEKARTVLPDLIVTDVMLPKKSGDVLVRDIRAEPRLRGVPVIILTARADDELRIRVLREGAQDCLNKPFASEELRARVKNFVVTKRAMDILREELESQAADIETLALKAKYRKRELEAALDTVRVAREQAEGASQAKTAFLGMVSHELRTPLTSLQLLLDRLRAAAPEPLVENTVRRMAPAMDRLIRLVDALLEHARVQSGSLRVEPERVNVGALVLELVDELRPQADAKGLWLHVQVPADGIVLFTDPHLVRLVISNIFANAVKFTAQGGIEVEAGESKEEVFVRVTDTGPGIAPSEQARIFEPFEQLEPLRRKHIPGVGLGLTLVRNIVEVLGGRIEVASEVGKGSTFEVRFVRNGLSSNETRSHR